MWSDIFGSESDSDDTTTDEYIENEELQHEELLESHSEMFDSDDSDNLCLDVNDGCEGEWNQEESVKTDEESEESKAKKRFCLCYYCCRGRRNGKREEDQIVSESCDCEGCGGGGGTLTSVIQPTDLAIISKYHLDKDGDRKYIMGTLLMNDNEGDEGLVPLGGCANRNCSMVDSQQLSGGNEETKSGHNNEYNKSFDVWEQLKSIGPKLVPFFKTLGMYFVIYIPVERPSTFGMLIKCLPIFSLALFILLHGVTLRDESKFSRRILAGLLFSCLGDAFLVWPSYFIHGMAAFGVAQCFYIRAFGFDQLQPKIGAALYVGTSIGIATIMSGLLLSEWPILIGLPIYSFMLTTMIWRAIARLEKSKEEWTWTSMCSSVGGLLFGVSDTVLALDKFYADIPYSQVLIMITYYVAQLAIALSVVNLKTKNSHNEARDDAKSVSSPPVEKATEVVS